MLKVLNKTIKKIDKFEEECSDLILGLGTLLGENVSIADVAVNPNPKDKKIEEAILSQDRTGKLKKDGVILSPEDQKQAKDAKRRKETIVAGDEDPAETVEPDPDAESEETFTKKKQGSLKGRIIKTEKMLETDETLRKWVSEYFAARRKGSFQEANIIKKRIDSNIDDKNLGRETVYFRADDVEKDDPDEEPEVEEPEDEDSDKESEE